MVTTCHEAAVTQGHGARKHIGTMSHVQQEGTGVPVSPTLLGSSQESHNRTITHGPTAWLGWLESPNPMQNPQSPPMFWRCGCRNEVPVQNWGWCQSWSCF